MALVHGSRLERKRRLLRAAAVILSAAKELRAGFAILAAWAPTLLAAQSSASPPPHLPVSYDITLVTSDTGAHVLGEVQVGWRLGSAEPVVLDLDSTLRVVRVLVDGKPNTRISRTMYGRHGNDVIVPHQKSAGDSLSTRVRYHGTPRGGIRVGADLTGARALAAETAAGRGRLWLPVPGIAEARATVAWHLQVGRDQRAIANGALVSIDTLAYGRTTWHYRLDVPVPLDGYAAAVGRYAVTALPRAGCRSGCVPVTLWTAPDDSAKAGAGAFRRAGEMLDFLSGLLGPFPYSGIAHVAASLPPDGRAGASLVLYDAVRVHEGRIDELEVAGATAAQWFGNAVSETGDPAARPSPAIAGYLALLWARQRGGPARSEVVIPRGAAAIERLHRTVGDSVFFRGLRRYVQANRLATAVPGGLERAMSETAGHPVGWTFRGQEAPASR